MHIKLKLKAASVIIVTLLLTGTLTSIFTSHLVLAKNETSEEKKTLLNDDAQLMRNATEHTKEEIQEQGSILKHKVTTHELEQLKGAMGVRKESGNYNQVINGHGTGLRPPTEDEWKRIADSTYIVDTVTYPAAPSSVDQSATPWFPPIGNQDGEGSCTAWAVGYYIKTFQEAKEHAWDLSGAAWVGGYIGYPTPSYQNRITSPSFIYNLINGGVDGGSSVNGAVQLVSFVGAASWEKMPYYPSDYTTWPSEAAWTEAPLFRGDPTGIQIMDVRTNLANLKNLIASQNLAVILVDANQYSGLTSSDLWTLDNYGNPSLNHANTIVGYNDTIAYIENGHTQYGAFKVANSWGVGGWEKVNDGFYWISYETMKQRVSWCAFYLDRIGYAPELVASFEISHSKRAECDITVGVGDHSSPIATKRFNDYVDGGAHPFCPNKILFDVTEFTDVIQTIYGQTYFLGVYDSGGPTTGTIKSFAIGYAESVDPPISTVNGGYVYAEVLLSQGAGTTVSFTLSPNPATPSQTVQLQGTLKTASAAPVYPAQVRVEYSTDGGATWHSAWTLGTNAAGQFGVSFTAPGAGTYMVRVSYAGSATYSSSSHTETLTVGAAAPPTVEIWTNKATYARGETLTAYIQGFNPGPATPVKVNVWFGLPGGGMYLYETYFTGTIPTSYTSPVYIWKSVTIPTNTAPGTYSVNAEMRNPTTNALIDSDTYPFTIT
jgi:hypothetical protein